jgi:tetratricopeptide (TPR) repeat protein
MTILCACANQEIHQNPPQSVHDTADLIRLAEDAYDRSNWELAEQYYSGLVTSEPDNVHYWYRLGNILAFMGKNSDAITAYNRALTLDPDDATVWYNLGMTQLKQAAYVLNAMQSQVDPGDPVSQRANTLLQGILELIQENR